MTLSTVKIIDVSEPEPPEAGASPRHRDFPYYSGLPVPLTPWGCAVVLIGCVAAYAALLGANNLLPGWLGGGLGVALFVLIPLAGLALATGREWKAIIPRPTARDIWVGFAFAPLTFAASAAVALALVKSGLTSDNPIAATMSNASSADLGLYFASIGGQLMGEELVTILPFLVILTLMHAAGASRRTAILTAWIVTALIFGAIHLPTYQWHLGQSLLVIGMARLVLTAPFLITKNIWSSYIAHVTNDWSLFTLLVVFPSL